MSQETASSNKRLYYRLQGEINCLKKLMEQSAESNFSSVTYRKLRLMLQETTAKLETTIENSKQLGYVKPGSFKRQV